MNKSFKIKKATVCFCAVFHKSFDSVNIELDFLKNKYH